MIRQMKPPVILPMDSRLMPRSLGWRSSGRSFAKGGADASLPPSDGSGASGSNSAVMMVMMLYSCVC